jgi:cobaltochelatase CobT
MGDLSPPDEPAEIFKKATVATARALSGEREMEVIFSADPPGLKAKRARIPLPARDLPAHDRALVRGSADAAALRLKYHQPGIYRRHQPAGDTARLVYDALEQARCEALGAHAMPGIAQNVAALLSERSRRQGYDHASERAQVGLQDALRFMAFEKLSGGALPPNAQSALALWRPWIEKRIGAHLGDLPKLLGDQEAYAAEVRRLLRDMNMDFPGNPDDESEDGEEKPDAADPNAEAGEQSEETHAGESQQELSEDQMAMPQEGDAQGEAEETAEQPSMGEATAEQDQMEDEAPAGSAGGASHLTSYNAFTQQFDETVGAETLCPPDELIRLRLQLDNQLRQYQGIVARLANRLQRKLMAQQARSWDFDREEGMLDAARLSRVVSSPGTPLSFKVEKDTEFRDTVVSLLIDNSGSMRGRPITLAAITADILSRTLERCAVKVEILGFTTSAWKGGKSRESWLKAGKPLHPGRLNDLRHIIYKSADAPMRRARKNLGLMLREGLLKENIDGEALLWAHERLLARHEERRILMVISDGAPVDDSTLSVNPGIYLEQHLRQVINWIEATSPVELSAIGIGHDVTRYYKRAVTLTDAEQLGGTVLGQLAELFEVNK